MPAGNSQWMPASAWLCNHLGGGGDGRENLALGKPANMSSTGCDCGKAEAGNDGDMNTMHTCDTPCVHTCGTEVGSWTVDLLDRSDATHLFFP